MNSKHYKDFGNERKINNKSSELENLKEIAGMLKNAYLTDDPFGYLKKSLINGEETNKETHPNHVYCSGFDNKTTEERICHCMFYYDNEPSKCKDCKLDPKWKNVGNVGIMDYATPMSNIIKGIGEIDLLLRYEGELYAAEVKAQNSGETVSRMLAEILTYTSIEISYKPALLVFEDSYQYKTIKTLIEDEDQDLAAIRDKVKMFAVKIISEENGVAEYDIVLI